jgi:hypothetical protein
MPADFGWDMATGMRACVLGNPKLALPARATRNNWRSRWKNGGRQLLCRAAYAWRQLIYNGDMARGWESKSVEAQIEDKKSNPFNQTDGDSLTPAEVHSKIKRANLLLSRKRILQQLEVSGSERYSELLRRSLAELDGQLRS